MKNSLKISHAYLHMHNLAYAEPSFEEHASGHKYCSQAWDTPGFPFPGPLLYLDAQADFHLR